MDPLLLQQLEQNLYWILPLVLVELVLKGFALWRAGRNNHPVWFVFLLLINSAGILPAVYLLGVDYRKTKTKKK